jgi:hypothetical protein
LPSSGFSISSGAALIDEPGGADALPIPHAFGTKQKKQGLSYLFLVINRHAIAPAGIFRTCRGAVVRVGRRVFQRCAECRIVTLTAPLIDAVGTNRGSPPSRAKIRAAPLFPDGPCWGRTMKRTPSVGADRVPASGVRIGRLPAR